jgi:antitoxin component YwqK of YwqJK toxin-antitoxin module
MSDSSLPLPPGVIEVKTAFYGSCAVHTIKRYLDGQLHGDQEEYHLNGKKMRFSTYKNGKMYGTCLLWDEEGNKESEWQYENDRMHGLQIAFYPNGRERRRYTFVHGVQEGKEEEWFSDGTPSYEFYYVHDKPHGVQKSWYSNGNKHYEREYVHGKKHGVRREWSINGTLIMEYNYVEGIEHGIQKRWEYNGHPICEYEMLNGEYHGKGTFWNYTRGDGKMAAKLENTYVNGNKHGIQFTHKFDGTVETEEFIHGYLKKHCIKMLYILRKLKWLRLARLVKTRAFIEWWYSPDNYGGKFSKKSMLEVYTGIGKKRSLEGTETQPDPKKQKL